MAKALTTQELRELFIDYFVQRGHRHLPSSPIVPIDDPTLLFTSAGMVQFKSNFAATGDLEFRRATTVQKCFRATDLEQVGHTPRHLTFFEMLGNFSFGDYFKREAIRWAWEFVTDVLDMDTEGIWVTVYLDDDEAAALWRDDIGVPAERIVRLGKKDNFWGPAGTTGACGPSSEIYMDLGEKYGCGGADCKPGCDCDRFQEFWNLVFPQYDMNGEGEMIPLARPGIDTGMGLERLTQLLQNTDSVFTIDEFLPLRQALADMVEVDLEREDHRTALNVITEHARSVTMLFSEGVYPSNEGRGYVARRILRRAARRGLALGITDPFLYRLTGHVIDTLAVPYPGLAESRDRIAKVTQAEETRFLETLERGMRRFEEAVERTRKRGETVISGKDAFQLYDTYGFPIDMTEEMAEEHGLTADMAGFTKEMEKQIERARATARFDEASEEELPWVWSEGTGPMASTAFVGYDTLETEVRVLARRQAGEVWEFILDTTPFYAEGGGQVGDHGWLEGPTERLEVVDVRRVGGEHVHRARLVSGDAFSGDRFTARVDLDTRRSTERNHTATHLLHAALKRVVGDHVTQAGSLVAPDRLRFDFNHFAPLTPAQIRAVEDDVNRVVLGDAVVEKEVTSMEDARKAGAVAMFGEKYGDTVRQVFVRTQDGELSRELCGGCHLRRTGEIGSFRIVAEESVGSGVRRVEAVTGWNAVRHLREEDEVLHRVEGLVRAGSLRDVETRVQSVVDENDRLKKELQRAQAALVTQSSGDVLDGMETVDGVPFLAAEFPVDSVKALRDAADQLRDRIPSGVGLLGARTGEKASLLAFVTDDLIRDRGLRADVLVKEVAKLVDGGGGGKPQLATAGGKLPGKIPEALKAGRGVLERLLAAAKS